MKFARSLVALIAMVALAPVAHAAPLRTLVYHFSIDGRGFGPPATGSTVLQPDSFASTGRITVEVVAATTDGGLVVDVTEDVDRVLRPEQAVRCALYGRTSDVICDQNRTVTQEEGILLHYVGRFFYDPAILDANQHWHSSPNVHNEFTVDNDYSVIQQEGQLVTVSVSRRERGGGHVTTVKGSVVYDTATDVPTGIRLEASTQGASSEGNMSVDLRLLSDSMAQPTPAETR